MVKPACSLFYRPSSQKVVRDHLIATIMGRSTKVQKQAVKPKQKEITTSESEKIDDKIEREFAESSSESAENSEESDLDDEFEVDQASSDESKAEKEGEGEEEEDSETDDEFPLKKKKKTSSDGSEQFASAFNAILGSKLKAYDRKDPILARNKSTLKKLESDRLEKKAKRELHAEKKQLQDKVRVQNLLPAASEPEKVREIIEKEKKLKKVAQRGVVKLFNALLATQVKTKEEISKANVSSGKKEEMLNEISKSKFLDLVKAAGNV